jgi:Flp pilus assembly protein protease CpaA
MLVWAPFVLMLIAAGFDLFNKREIPDAVPALILMWSICAIAFGWQSHDWISAAAGCVLGLAVGLVLFQLGGFGGADVKLIASLGAAFGLTGEILLLFYMAIAGAGLALVAKVRGQTEFAYAPAIAIGTFIVIFRGTPP